MSGTTETTGGDDLVQALARDVGSHEAPQTDELRCNVCNGESGHPALGVACSSLGPISFAYCRPCLENRAEPYSMLRGIVLWDCGGLEGCAEWVHHLTTWHDGKYIPVSELPPLTDAERAEYQAMDDQYASAEWEEVL